MLFKKKNKKIKLAKLGNSSPEINWFNDEESGIEGQLAIDVYQTAKNIFIKSTIAGVNPEDLKISLHNDLLTISGTRSSEIENKEGKYLYQECYWGSFSRSIILPSEVDSKQVKAELENGILTITLNKKSSQQIKVKSKN